MISQKSLMKYKLVEFFLIYSGLFRIFGRILKLKAKVLDNAGKNLNLNEVLSKKTSKIQKQLYAMRKDLCCPNLFYY